MKGRDIVIVGIQPWDYSIGSNCKNIALEFSKQNRVLYVNQPLDRISSITSRRTPAVQRRLSIVNGKTASLEQAKKNLWTYYPKFIMESINKLPPGKIFNKLTKYNSLRFGKEIQSAINEIGFKVPILFNDSSFFLGMHLSEVINIDFSIYYIRDNLVSQPYFRKHGRYLEPRLASSVDLVVGNSDYLVNYLKPFNPNSKMVGQGCDLTFFNPSKGKSNLKELKNIKNSIIGYVGVLTALRLDIPLLVKIAKSLPNYSLVLIGPEDDEFSNSVLHKFENVYFLGQKKEHELASYIARFDVALNPQLINQMTIGNYPRKIDEYLAMGKAVVATKTESMAFFKDHVELATTHTEFIQKIVDLIDNDTSKMEVQRINFANSHSWQNSVKQIYKAVEESYI